MRARELGRLATAVFFLVSAGPGASGAEEPPARPDEKKRFEAAMALIGRDDAKSRLDGLRKLRDLRGGASEAIPAVIAQIANPDWAVGQAAMWTLKDIGPADRRTVSALVEALSDARPGARETACWVLSGIGKPAREAAPGIRKLLKDPDPTVARAAANAIWHVAGEAGPAVQLHVAALRQWGPVHEHGHNAIIALGSFGPEAAEAVPLIVQVLGHQQQHRVSNALRTLEKIGPAAEKAVPHLCALLNHPAHGRQLFPAIAITLGSIGPAAAPAVPQLAARLKDPSSSECYHALRALGKIGPRAKSTLPALLSMVGSCREAGSLAEAAGSIASGSPEVVPQLVKMAEPGDDRGRLAIAILGRMGAGTADAVVPALLDMIGPDRERTKLVLKALGRTGPAAEKAVPELIRLAEKEHHSVADVAIEALGDIGANARAAVPMLTRLVARGRFGSYAATRALARIGVFDEEVLAVLQQGLSRGSFVDRERTAWALGQAGPKARGALPALRKCLTHERIEVRRAAAEAIALIEPGGGGDAEPGADEKRPPGTNVPGREPDPAGEDF